MATTKTYKPKQLYAVLLADLQADANQPRKYLDSQVYPRYENCRYCEIMNPSWLIKEGLGYETYSNHRKGRHWLCLVVS
jgi:hypothetical protein